MKTTSITAAAALAALIGLSACNPKDEAADAEGLGQTPPVNAVQDMASAPVGMGSAATIGATTTDGFVMGAAMGDMYEIEASKIAMDKATNPQIKALAKTLVEHHTAMSNELKATLKSANIAATPPAALDERRKGMLDNLRAASDGFDLAWLHQQLAAHTEAMTMLKGFEAAGDNDALKALAVKAQPKVQMHIDQIKKIGGAELDART